MIPYATYKLLHYLGIFVLLTALAARLGRSALSGSEGSRSGSTATTRDTGGSRPIPDPWARRLGIVHGVALLLVLLGGFGMLARLDISHWPGLLPGWIWAKLAIWTALGAAIRVASRSASWSARVLLAAPALAILAALVALTKPF